MSIYDDLIEAGLQVPEGDEGLSDFRPPADLYETLERQGQASFDEIGRRFNTKLSGWIEYLFTVGLGSGPELFPGPCRLKAHRREVSPQPEPECLLK